MSAGTPAAGERTVTATDGRRLVMRPITAGDADALVAFHGTLSADSIYFRFFSPHPTLTQAEVDRFTHVDGRDRVALVLLDADRIVAVGRYDRRDETPEAEVAFVVTDAWQHLGLATYLLRSLAEIAVTVGIDTFFAETLADNRRMRAVFADAGYPVQYALSDGVVHVTFRIDGSASLDGGAGGGG